MTQEQYDLERMRAWAVIFAELVAHLSKTLSNDEIASYTDSLLETHFDSRFSPNQGKKEEAE